MLKRIVMPAMVIAAMAAMILVVTPTGAIGEVPLSPSAQVTDRHTFGRDVVISEPVSGSVQVYRGSADIQNLIEGDLLVLGGNINFSSGGHVKGNVIYGGGRVLNGEGRVDGRVYSLASVEGAAASLTKNAVVLSLLLVWLITAIVVTLVSPREVRLSSMEVRISTLHCFALGLVAVTSFVLTAIVFSYLVPYLIGIPLLAALAVFATLTKIYGLIAVFHAVGTIVAGLRTREQLNARKWLRGDLAMVIVGVLILGAIRLIPVVGPIVWSAASIFGVGVTLATKFGRREPWFLTWRPAEA
jgi:hypothetical protein